MSKKHQQAKPASGVVTSDVVQHGVRAPYRRREIIVAGCLAVVLVAAIVYGFFGPRFWLRTNDTQPLSTLAQQHAAAINVAKEQVANARTPAQKSQANQMLGAAYLADNQADNAIGAYKTAVAADGSTKTAVLDQLGYAYAKAGQRDEAIATYQELIRLMQAQPQPADHVASSYGGSGIEKYQQYVDTLQQGGSL